MMGLWHMKMSGRVSAVWHMTELVAGDGRRKVCEEKRKHVADVEVCKLETPQGRRLRTKTSGTRKRAATGSPLVGSHGGDACERRDG